MSAAWLVLGGALALAAYTYLGYPLLLWIRGALLPRPDPVPPRPGDWPAVSVTVPVYNEAAQIRETIDSLLAIDYPADRLQILIVSDGSTDGTDEIVAGYADRGVELLRVGGRGGKTAAENAAIPHLRGEVVVNTDASIRVRPDAVRHLVTRFADPTVGVASGRDVSVGGQGDRRNVGESGYVGFEMWLRGLESRVDGIVGASGCLYAARASIHAVALPAGLSRDFASVLVARERGLRAVSVDEAVCLVPRTASPRREYRRKVRTMAQGIGTLLAKRALLDPRRHGGFAWMLFSHKLCRWLVPWAALAALAALLALSPAAAWARAATAGAALLLAAAAAGWLWPSDGPGVPRLVAVPAFAVMANVAALHAWLRALKGELEPAWEPTRRGALEDAAP